MSDRTRQEFAQRCFAWVNEAETFLDARKAGGPRPHHTGGLRAQLRAGPEPSERRRERETYERETVALYIERHRNRGVAFSTRSWTRHDRADQP
jgi:hypothetical protein